jgi:hypothetical protein
MRYRIIARIAVVLGLTFAAVGIGAPAALAFPANCLSGYYCSSRDATWTDTISTNCTWLFNQPHHEELLIGVENNSAAGFANHCGTGFPIRVYDRGCPAGTATAGTCGGLFVDLPWGTCRNFTGSAGYMYRKPSTVAWFG